MEPEVTALVINKKWRNELKSRSTFLSISSKIINLLWFSDIQYIVKKIA